VLAIAGLSAIALAVRLVIALRGGLWRDEALFLSVTRLPSWNATLDFLRFHESHPPLFYALMKMWILAFGDTDARSIIPSVIFGVVLVPVIYFVGKSLFSQRVGLLAAAFAALSPALTEYSAGVRPYSVMPLLALLSTYTLIRGLQRGGVRTWAAHALSTVALLYTHNWGWLVVVGEWMSVLLVFLWSGTRPSTTRFKEWLVMQGVIGIAYLPWASTLVYQMNHAGHAPSVMALRSEPVASIGTSVHLLLKSTILAYSPLDTIGGQSLLTLFFALPLMLMGIDQYLRTRSAARASGGPIDVSHTESSIRENRMAIVCLLAVPITAWIAALILSSNSNLMLRSCLVTLAPMLLLTIAYWAERPRRGAMLLITRGAIVGFLLTYAVSLYALFQTSRSSAREVASAVALQTRPTDLVILTPEWLASSFNRYYSPAVAQIDYPHLGREDGIAFTGMLERFTDEAAASRARARIRQTREESRRVWLITDRDNHFAVSPAEMRNLLESSHYGLVAIGRTDQLRAQLDTLYGSPDSSINYASLPPRYESIHAFLYTPRDKDRHE